LPFLDVYDIKEFPEMSLPAIAKLELYSPLKAKKAR
jgi:hypothetical protein